ncbi:hypothetical protein [Oceanobacter antarcticus]|jgi:hypothetical protein|uniref:Uncharacterized protein n=1 Tax=Oceanobacter antarcticus TaxID=3133425 RepID=A0ABW8NMQ9_9GAMM
MTNERIVRSRKPRKCPACGFAPVGSILYGFPLYSEQLQEEMDSGKTIIGGCEMPVINEAGEWDSPHWQCSRCGCEIYKSPPEKIHGQ